MTKLAARAALVCALVGLAASMTAVYVHYHLLFDPHYTTFCDINASVSCTAVYQSRYSTVWGVPVAIFSGIWFFCAALLSVGAMVARPAIRESLAAYLFAGSTLALSAALYLAYVSISILHTYCPVCLTIDAAVVGLFLVSGAATSIPMTTLPRRLPNDLRALIGSPLALAVTIVFVASAGSALAFFPREAAAEPAAAAAAPGADVAGVATQAAGQSDLEKFMASAPRVPLIVPSEGAKVLIVKFNDFQCPACGHAYLAYKPILARYEATNPGAVKVVLKDYPLNTTCNPASGMVHPSACDAAVAVRLARQHNRGPEMEDWFYTHQPQMTPPSVRQAAKDIGQVPDYEAKYAATLALIKGDVALGNELRIMSTPTFFINGVRVDGEWAPQFFDQAIAYELKHPR
jgi:uncharacterized membrane protein/protein-disulfide isomerase